jgi:hypothetical protein
MQIAKSSFPIRSYTVPGAKGFLPVSSLERCFSTLYQKFSILVVSRLSLPRSASDAKQQFFGSSWHSRYDDSSINSRELGLTVDAAASPKLVSEARTPFLKALAADAIVAG